MAAAPTSPSPSVAVKLEADEELCRMDALVEDNLSGSCVCSMSSDVDLTLRDDLAANAQDYLSRIVDELHLISRWTADCCRYMLVCQEKQTREYNRSRASEHEKTLTEAAIAANSPQNLLFQTDLELLRQEMQRSHLEIYQRCATNIAYVQSSFRTEHDEQLNELQKRFDDKIRFFTQQTIGIIEKHHSEGDARMKNIETSIRQLQKQLVDDQKKLSSLESSTTSSIATLSSSLYTQQGDTVSCIRRVENVESSLSLQLNDMRSSIDEPLHSLKAGHSQLSSKIQVIRLELQENSDDCQRKLQQLSKHLQNRSSGANHHQDTTTRMPALLHQSTGIRQHFAPPSATSASSYTQQSNPRMRNESLDFVSANGIPSSSYTGSGGGVKIPTGAAALATPDCFLYAKAALPHREGAADAVSLKRSAAYSTTGSGGNFSIDSEQPAPSPLRSPSTAEGRSRSHHDSGTPFAVGDVLIIQQSVLSQLLGREDEQEAFLETTPAPELLRLSTPDRPQKEEEKEKQALTRPATTAIATAVPPPSRPSISIDSVSSKSPPFTAVPVASPRKTQASRLVQQKSSSGNTPSSTFPCSPAAPSRPDSTRGR